MDTIVRVRYPHERHGNAGKTSHSAKTSVMQDFLQFVDLNSQPNGRSADSTDLQCHRQIADDSHKHFMVVTKKCSAEISELEEKLSLNDDERERLAVLKHRFNLVVSADYQMSKLGECRHSPVVRITCKS